MNIFQLKQAVTQHQDENPQSEIEIILLNETYPSFDEFMTCCCIPDSYEDLIDFIGDASVSGFNKIYFVATQPSLSVVGGKGFGWEDICKFRLKKHFYSKQQG